MEFSGVLKKESVEIPRGSVKKEAKFPGVFKEKLMWNFHRS